MRQLVQSVRDGHMRVVEFPTPSPGPTEVLVATRRSLISSGTENAVRALASANLVRKAKARPDLVRQVFDKAKADGLKNTLKAVRTRLDDEMPLGYSAVGVAVEVGEAVDGIRPGDRVATASAGHGDYQLVPGLLCAKVPDNVDDASAAFATVGAIALHGLRQADVGVDSLVAVIGLGLVGQLTVRLAIASGLRVIGIDLRKSLVDLTSESGADAFVESGPDTTHAILDLTEGMGVDGVLITAATTSSEPVTRATDILRDRGRIVVVGDVGLELDRRPFYEKELDLRFARSYGPGRYERSYEEFGIDLPVGYVRWTEGRNLQAVLSLMSRGRVVVTDLVTQTHLLDDASQAYASFDSDPQPIGVQFIYDAPVETIPKTSFAKAAVNIKRVSGGDLRAGIIGAGTYAKVTLLPALREAGWPRPVAITSATGLNARTLADKYSIPTVAPDAESLIHDPDVSVVFILSRHDSHAEMAVKALLAGKDVFVEKPVALTWDELDRVREAQQMSGRVLWAGFNRRYSPAVTETKNLLSVSTGPLVIAYRVNAGPVAGTHWYKDRRQGGRLLGEICHFVDTVSWLVGAPLQSIVAFGDGLGESQLQENVTLAFRYADGCSSSVMYSAAASPRTPKEQIDIMGRGQSVAIDNFASMKVNGSRVRLTSTSKGHVESLRAFAEALRSGAVNQNDARLSFESTAATLAAVQSMQSGRVQGLV